MSTEKLKSDLDVIEEKKKILRKKEKEIREREKKQQIKSFEKIGRIAIKASLPDLDDDALLGAFFELSEKSKQEENLIKWREMANSINTKNDKENGTPLVIKFSKHPEKEVRDNLKNQGFKWNSFRGEFYGFGSFDFVKNTYEKMGAQIEVVD